MTVPVPTAIPVVSGWAVVDWLDRPFTSPPAVGGVALLELPTLPDTDRWQLTHVVCGCSSIATTAMRLYLNSVSNAGLRDGTSDGNFDVADWAMGLMVPPGGQLLARWTGCNDGDVGTLNLQANILRKVS